MYLTKQIPHKQDKSSLRRIGSVTGCCIPVKRTTIKGFGVIFRAWGANFSYVISYLSFRSPLGYHLGWGVSFLFDS